ncbi:outer membrane protein assembly factor BamA [Meridianimarinicoccus roseus]|uniref:Outer membrane protein assembly factor BamA n=1 Tax=Meridianimarinicoccus roseus TaxID=2072018 RepID=A0A2V2LD53_9RHOB|nr:outer membrane protein assembly factor BamA [Meridianimarinicoccus roseus]PWR03315.1 outer membrane protein assembly factor BamA [Meridianimarinicoccus roseus]
MTMRRAELRAAGRKAAARWARLAGLALAAGCVSGAVWAQASFGQIDVRGNQRIETSTVLTYAGIEPGSPVTAGQINAAKQRLLASGLFESVEVTPARGTLIIEVQEFPTINRISIEGNRRLNDEVLEGLVTSQPRRVYSPSTATADARAIADAYFQAGRLAATVTPKIIVRDQNRVDLVFEVTEAAVVEVERIGFVGNRSFSDRRLRQALGTKQAGIFRQIIRRDTFLEDRVQFDRQVLTDFYRSRGFVDFEVLSVTPEFSRERDAFFLTFNIREGQRFELGEISVTTDVPDLDVAAFERVVRARTGQTYSPTRIEDTVARLEREAIELGLDFIRADPVITRNDRELTLDVAFNLTRGPRILVERIDIEGNSTTLDRVIRRQFRVVEGDPFNPREIRDSAERIRALGYFANSDVTTREGTAPDRVIVDVNVEEQPTGSLTLGGSYSLDEGFGFAIGLSERNFLGRGQFLNVSIAAGIDNNNSSLTLAEPSLLGRDLNGSVSIYYRSTDSFNADFNTDELGFRPTLGFPVSDNGRLELNYRLSRDTISDVQSGDPTILGDNGSSAIIQREEGRLVTSSIGYNYSYNSARTGLDPNTRYRFEFGQNFGGVGGDTQFVETLALAGYETKVMNEDVGLSATVRGAALNFTEGNSRVIDRYRGRNYARGFTANGIGPRDLTATNQDALGGNYAVGVAFEADFPVGLPEEYGIRGGVFYDIGSIWGLDDTAGTGGEVDDDFHLRQVIGATIFWTTPIGPLRFDFTRALEKEDYDDERTFDFRVSTRF